MAIKLIANYSKRLGLPGYSSHQFEVSVETEIGNTSELNFAVESLYASLQSTVDSQIQQVGFVPDTCYGLSEAPAYSSMRQVNPPVLPKKDKSVPPVTDWKCSEKQRSVILSLSKKCKMDNSALHELSVQRFRKGVSQLNKLEASSLINELIEQSGGTPRQATSSRNYAPQA